MKIIGNGSARSFVLAAALSIGLGFGTHASADYMTSADYLVDLNSKTATSFVGGGGLMRANAINDAGRVVGSINYLRYSDAFVTGPDGIGVTNLDIMGWASGINAAGQVVGRAGWHEVNSFITGPNGIGRIVLSTPGEGVMNPVGRTFPNDSVATGVNAAGQVVGNIGRSYSDSPYLPHAFITGPNGVNMTDIGTLGGNQSQARGINDAGRVVGESFTADGENHAFITGPNGVGMTDLGTLGGANSSAYGINGTGQVVGWASMADGQQHAFITGPNGVGMTDLGTLGGANSWATGINDAGQVVGWSDMAGDSTNHAFITGPNGMGMVDLNSLVDLPAGVVLTNARDTNNMGQVIATSVIATGIVPEVPEPDSYALMLAGLTLMGAMVRRKQKD
jgi:probable HAF family extracellular repeat protein